MYYDLCQFNHKKQKKQTKSCLFEFKISCRTFYGNSKQCIVYACNLVQGQILVLPTASFGKNKALSTAICNEITL